MIERLHLHHNWLFTFQHNSFTTSSFFQANKHKKASFQQNAAFEEMKTFSRRLLLGFEKCTYSASCSYHFHGHSHADECPLGPFCWSVALLWTSEFSLIEVTIFNKRMPHKTFVTVVCRSWTLKCIEIIIQFKIWFCLAKKNRKILPKII